MDKKFTEYSHFDLSAINKEVLKNGTTNKSFIKAWKYEKVHLRLFLRRTSFGQRYAGYTSRHGPFHQRYFLPI